MDRKITESSFERVKQWGSSSHLGTDLLLLNLENPGLMPREARRMSFIFLALCTRGWFECRLDGRKIAVGKGDLIVVSERHVVSEISLSDTTEGLCMAVSPSFLQDIIRDVSDLSALFLTTRTNPVIAVGERDATVFSEYFSVIKSKLEASDNRFRKELARTLMLAMFYDLSNIIYRTSRQNVQHQSRADDIFARFIKMVEENCHQERRVSWYARQLCITPKYLSETVKSVSRRTPNEWIDNYVLLHVRVLLKNTTKSIKSIAEEMHFSNQSFLGKYFKEHVGMSPTAYRARG